MSAWSPIDRCQSAEEAEAIAALEGIQLARLLNSPIMLESDCQQVVDAINRNSWGRSQASLVYAEASAAAQGIHSFKIQKVHRTANSAAHSLAAFSRRTETSGVMQFSAPVCVLNQLKSDCNYDCHT